MQNGQSASSRKKGIHHFDVGGNESGVSRGVRGFRPDVITADYIMPEFDGIQASKLMQEQDTALPLILLTRSLVGRHGIFKSFSFFAFSQKLHSKFTPPLQTIPRKMI
jgi:hypothetical protein